ncbi:MAG: SHOCT domain-containing protein [Candidatus Geothermincolia bacterium]
MGFVRRRPLMRAAVVGGGAYAIGKRSARKQDATNQSIEDAQEQAQQAQQMAAQAATAPAPAPAGGAGISEEDIQKLQELAKLHDSGILTDEEFATEKKQILEG